MEKRTFKEQALAWGFLSPALIVLIGFGLFPIGYAFYVSLHRWRIKKDSLVGFEHYQRAIGDLQSLGLVCLGVLLLWAALRWHRRLSGESAGWLTRRWLVFMPLALAGVWLIATATPSMLDSGDPRLYNGFKVNVFYVLGTIPAELSLSLGLASLLFWSARGRSGFRVLYFLPYVTPAIASAVVFRTLFNPHPSSIANLFWGFLGFENQRWLFENKSVMALILQGLNIHQYPAWVDQCFPSLALVSVILYNVWVYIGYNTVILLAGLSAIPRHYYEAAAIDGANAWQVFRQITLPLISPTLFFLSMIAVIGTFKAFNHIYIMRTVGARDSVDVLSILIFDQIFQYHNAGYASALAFILFIAILGLTVVQNRVLGRRVFYGD